ncbi:hypothetical protein POTOM_057887 [Populus tomentosa]|uniref:Serine-threonine/tyrosine-protein kinase catalytic domain-containing protein n=1 Tax=Populus tomentosa TaxID=118781 RepID=A0A8X7XQ37_POPTO|nr:hypothetical protein POTOM_057887 [Populus tomentosa]
MAPEYALYGYLTYKADVYNFSVVALEIVSGMNNVKFRRDENFVCLLDWVLYLQKNEDIMEMVDPRLGSEFNKKDVREHRRKTKESSRQESPPASPLFSSPPEAAASELHLQQPLHRGYQEEQAPRRTEERTQKHRGTIEEND